MKYKNDKFISIVFDSAVKNVLGLTKDGGILCFDLTTKSFNLVTEIKHAVLLESFFKNTLHAVVGGRNGTLHFVDCENSSIKKRQGHDNEIKIITFLQDELLCLTSCQNRVCFWDTSDFELKSIWTFSGLLKLLIHVPYGNQIVTGFQNEGIRIWKNHSGVKSQQVEGVKDATAAVLTRNNRIMVFASNDGVMREYHTKTWTLRRRVEIPDGIKDIARMHFGYNGGFPRVLTKIWPYGGSLWKMSLKTCHLCFLFQYILALTKCRQVFLLDFNKGLLLPIDHSGPDDLILSKNGKYILSFFNGSVLVNHTDDWLAEKVKPKPKTVKTEGFDIQIKSKMQENRHITRNFLKLFLKIPTSSRATFWKYFLLLPGNVASYKRLLSRGIHQKMSSLIKYDSCISNKYANGHLRLCSALVHWRPAISEIKSLPILAINFVKVFKNDPIGAFETMATLFENHFQNWYKEADNSPCETFMNGVDDALLQADPELYYHYVKYQITPSTYAWPIMETLFCTVFKFDDWVHLIDHIIVFGPYFIVAVIAAYNTLGRNVLLQCDSTYSCLRRLFTKCNIDVTCLLETSHLVFDKPSSLRYSDFKPLGVNMDGIQRS